MKVKSFLPASVTVVAVVVSLVSLIAIIARRDGVVVFVVASASSPRSARTTKTTTTTVSSYETYYEAEDGIFDPSSVIDVFHPHASGDSYVDMGGLGSWLEFVVRAPPSSSSSSSSSSADHGDYYDDDDDDVAHASSSSSSIMGVGGGGGGGGECTMSFRYSSGSSDKASRPCLLSLNGTDFAKLSFLATGAWHIWNDELVNVDCKYLETGTTMLVRITSLTRTGGPNVDGMSVSYHAWEEDGVAGDGDEDGPSTGMSGKIIDYATTDGGTAMAKEYDADTTAKASSGLGSNDDIDDYSSSNIPPPPSQDVRATDDDDTIKIISNVDDVVDDLVSNASPRPQDDGVDDCDDDDDDVIINDHQSTTSRRRYNKFPDGIVTYGLDDGGCYFCGHAGKSRNGIGTIVRTHPPNRVDLIDMCRDLCDSMPDCVSFTVGREPSYVVQSYLYGATISNCCLERRMYPPGLYVVGSGRGADESDGGGGRRRMKMDNCHMDASCWTRYEREGARDGEVSSSTRTETRRRCKRGVNGHRDDGSMPSSSSASSEGTKGSIPIIPPPSPSGNCIKTWEPVVYSDDEINEKSLYIAGGCTVDDDEKTNNHGDMLRHARDSCMAETLAESMTVSVVLRPSSDRSTHGGSAYVFVRAFADNGGVVLPSSAFPLS